MGAVVVLREDYDGPGLRRLAKALGKPPKLNAAHRQALAWVVESGPIPPIHGVVRWRLYRAVTN